jgi:FkbM family methyltransferase
MQILYGAYKYIDVTHKFNTACSFVLPCDEVERCRIFGDPMPGVLKHIKIIIDNKETIVPDKTLCSINIDEKDVHVSIFTASKDIIEIYHSLWLPEDFQMAHKHRQLTFMINEHDTVLETNAQRGFNSCIISSIVNDGLLCLEHNPLNIKDIQQIINVNIVCGALSRIPLYYRYHLPLQENQTQSSRPVQIISWPELNRRFQMRFSVLVTNEDIYYACIDEPLFFKHFKRILLDVTNTTHAQFLHARLKSDGFKLIYEQHDLQVWDITAKLASVHKTINFLNHDITAELPEQLMALKFIKRTDTVLELGANIGRNTCVISRILNDDTRLVTLETDPNNSCILNDIRIANGMNFSIVTAGLSKKKLIQKDWQSQPFDEDVIPDGWTEVPTINWNTLQEKTAHLRFNVLVADCEGALYYICQEEPDFIANFERVIIENDYHDLEHKLYLNQQLRKHGFTCIYSEAGGWGPCKSCFFETWAKLN